MPKKLSKRYGFTLIELLVSISIIAVLSMIGLVMYSSVYKSSRDAKRKSDIKFIQSALEDYHADQIYYPFAVTPGSALTSGTKKYMTEVPKDPSVSPNYSYIPSGTNCASDTPQNCTSYCLYAKMEMPIPVTDSDVGCGRDGGFPSGYNYGITRP